MHIFLGINVIIVIYHNVKNKIRRSLTVYKKYGDCFKKLRNQKNLGLSYFSKIGINRANLSRFERGQTMMSFERVDLMLEEMQSP